MSASEGNVHHAIDYVELSASDLPATRAPRPGTAARPTRGQEHLAYIASLGEPIHQQEIER